MNKNSINAIIRRAITLGQSPEEARKRYYREVYTEIDPRSKHISGILLCDIEHYLREQGLYDEIELVWQEQLKKELVRHKMRTLNRAKAKVLISNCLAELKVPYLIDDQLMRCVVIVKISNGLQAKFSMPYKCIDEGIEQMAQHIEALRKMQHECCLIKAGPARKYNWKTGVSYQ